MNVSYGGEKQFRSVNNLTKWVSGLYFVLMIASIVAIAFGYAQADLINRAISGEMITESEAVANDVRYAAVGSVQLAVSITSIIVFLVWVYRTHKNLRYLHAEGLRFTPGWAVGWFFVPFMSLFRPYQVVSEIWKASKPEVDTPDSWEKSTSSPIIGGWWAFFLISNFAGMVASRIWLGGEELSELLTATYGYMVFDATTVVWTIMAILLVKRISQFQEAKYRLISSPRG